MILFDTEQTKCYVFPRIDNNRSREWVSGIGEIIVGPGQTYPPDGFPKPTLFEDNGGRCIDYYQLIMIVDGSGTFIDRGIEYDVSAGSLLLIRPGYWHSYCPYTSTGWKEYFIGFEGIMFSRIISDAFPLTESNAYRIQSNSMFEKLFNLAMNHAKMDGEDTQLYLASILALLISKIVVEKKTDPKDSRNATYIVAKARAYMETNLSSKSNLNELANHLGMSYSSFATTFKEQTGYTPIRFLKKLRLQHAKYKLLQTTLTVKQISMECGFSSVEYFCNEFRNTTGKSPLEYRQEMWNQS